MPCSNMTFNIVFLIRLMIKKIHAPFPIWSVSLEQLGGLRYFFLSTRFSGYQSMKKRQSWGSVSSFVAPTVFNLVSQGTELLWYSLETSSSITPFLSSKTTRSGFHLQDKLSHALLRSIVKPREHF